MNSVLWSDKAEDQESKSENEKNRQQLVKESNELDTAQKSFDFQEQKIQEAQQLLAENGTMDLVMNSMMMYLNEAKDNYANEPVEKGAISIPLESKKVYVSLILPLNNTYLLISNCFGVILFDHVLVFV